MPVAVGRAAKFLEYLTLNDKSYRGEILAGIATDSGDDTGKIIAAADFASLPDEQELTSLLNKFVGKIKQTPPLYSAIKIKGKKARDLARKDREFVMPVREVNIYKISLVKLRRDTFVIDVECSKGTYIRSLATDIGQELNLPVTLKFLVRTRVGDFSLADACTLEELARCGEERILPSEKFLTAMPRYDLPTHRAKAFQNGLPTDDRNFEGGEKLLAVFGGGVFVGVGRYFKGSIYPVKVL